MKAFFYLSRGLAATESIIHGLVAAMMARAQLGVFGEGMATYYEAMGYANAALIMAQTFLAPSASGGGGSGATPSTSTATGSTGDTNQQSEGPRLGDNGIEGGGTVIVNLSVVAPLGKDYSKEDWERIAELYIQPAFSANGQRGVQISSAAVATA